MLTRRKRCKYCIERRKRIIRIECLEKRLTFVKLISEVMLKEPAINWDDFIKAQKHFCLNGTYVILNMFIFLNLYIKIYLILKIYLRNYLIL